MNARLQKALAVAALLAAPTLSSCGVSFGAQTDQLYTPTDGVNDLEGSVDVLHALIVSETPGTGRLIAGLVNNDTREDDALTQVSGAEESAEISVSIDGDAVVPAAGALQLADADAPVVLVTGSEEEVRAGGFVRVTFTFEGGESSTLNVPVLAPGTDYADVEIPDTATPSETTPTETPEG